MERKSDDVVEYEYERRYGILRANLEQMNRVRYVMPAKETGSFFSGLPNSKGKTRAYMRHGRLGSS